MSPSHRTGFRAVVFLTLHLAASVVLDGGPGTLRQAIFWLPTGVAISGLWLLGPRYWWVVAVSTFLQRLATDSVLLAVLPTVGSSLGRSAARSCFVACTSRRNSCACGTR